MRTILVVGSGGREHALAWKLAQSGDVDTIYTAPGNAGTGLLGENVAIAPDDTRELVNFAASVEADLTVVGPEVPLANGIVDAFQASGLPIFGPGRATAELEASKAFAKQFMRKQGIPTGDFAVFRSYEPARDYLAQQPGPVVIKASGLAAGKGVIVCDNLEQARAALQQIMVEKAFGIAGAEVLIEERLQGPEVSVLAFSDGRTIVPMIPARDHKRVYDGDQGPNTGGMGVYAPPPDVDEAFLAEITRTVLEPVVGGMAQQGTPYVGVLYAGLMLTASGPKVLEFNCRFGDPETQVVLPMLKGNLVEILLACVEGRLDPQMVSWYDGACAAVVMAAPGYPGSYPKGMPIRGLDALPEETMVFHAGTALEENQIITNGGRVLAVSAWGDDLPTAVDRAYEGVARLHFDGAHFRKDIGK